MEGKTCGNTLWVQALKPITHELAQMFGGPSGGEPMEHGWRDVPTPDVERMEGQG